MQGKKGAKSISNRQNRHQKISFKIFANTRKWAFIQWVTIAGLAIIGSFVLFQMPIVFDIDIENLEMSIFSREGAFENDSCSPSLLCFSLSLFFGIAFLLAVLAIMIFVQIVSQKDILLWRLSSRSGEEA